MFVGTGALQYLFWRIKCIEHYHPLLLCQKKTYDILKQKSGTETIKSILGLEKALQTCHEDIHKIHHAYPCVKMIWVQYTKKKKKNHRPKNLPNKPKNVGQNMLLVTKVLESYKEL